jgi:hypothetical protein
MELKGDRPSLAKLLVALGLFMFAEFAYFIYSSISASKSSLTGFSVNDTLNNLSMNFLNMSIYLKLFIMLQWIAVIFIAIVFVKRSRDKNNIEINTVFRVEKPNTIYKTDLDTLYNLLKEKKQIGISSIAKSYGVSKEVAMEWARILESGNLADLDYPGFGEPYLRLNEKSIETPVQKTIKVSNVKDLIKKTIENKDTDKKKDVKILPQEKKSFKSMFKFKKKKR